MVRMRGLVVPILTPFRENGDLDLPGMKEFLDLLLSAGVSNFYVLGTTGEVFLMDLEERKKVTEFVADHVADRGNIFVHVGSSSTRETCLLARHAQDLGVAGIGAVTPFYFKVTQREMEEYYIEVAASIRDDLPFYLYNIPSCSGNDLLPETVSALSRVENIVGIKNSMADIVRLSQLIDGTPEDFDVLIGADNILLPSILYGACGNVSGCANVFPEIFIDFYNAMEEQDYQRAHEKQIVINRIVNLLQGGALLSFFKYALQCRGFRPTYCRKPLLDLKEREKTVLGLGIEDILANHMK